MSLKIDIITPFFYPMVGGAETYVYELSTRLAKCGYDVTVHTSFFVKESFNLSQFEVINGVKVYRYKPIWRNYYYYWLWVPMISKTDVLHVCGYGHLCFSLTILRYSRKFPIISTPIGVSAPIEGPKSRLLRRLYDSIIGIKHLSICKKIIVLAEEEKQWCITRGIKEDKIIKIPVGIPEEAFLIYDPSLTKQLYNLEKYILYVGRIHKDKGVVELVKAFSLVNVEVSDLKLVFVGPDDGYRDEVQKVATQLNIQDKIVWVGKVTQEEKYLLISNCKILVLPSKYELQGIVLVEAMAQGKPVVATNVGGVSDFVKNGWNGFLVRYGDVESLADKIKILLSDSKIYGYLSYNAKKTAEEFKWDKIIDRYEKIYREIATIK